MTTDKCLLDWIWTEYVPNVDPDTWTDGSPPSKDDLELLSEQLELFIKWAGRIPYDAEELNDFVSEEPTDDDEDEELDWGGELEDEYLDEWEDGEYE